MTPVGYFQRWYDVDAVLSEMIQTLEMLSSQSQSLFGLLLERFSDRVIQVRGHEFYAQLDSRKMLGLAKSKQMRRWYDQETSLHKGFNKLYSLSDADKALIARELYTPIRLVRRYEEQCLERCEAPDIEQVQQIIAACFRGESIQIEADFARPIDGESA